MVIAPARGEPEASVAAVGVQGPGMRCALGRRSLRQPRWHDACIEERRSRPPLPPACRHELGVDETSCAARVSREQKRACIGPDPSLRCASASGWFPVPPCHTPGGATIYRHATRRCLKSTRSARGSRAGAVKLRQATEAADTAGGRTAKSRRASGRRPSGCSVSAACSVTASSRVTHGGRGRDHGPDTRDAPGIPTSAPSCSCHERPGHLASGHRSRARAKKAPSRNHATKSTATCFPRVRVHRSSPMFAAREHLPRSANHLMVLRHSRTPSDPRAHAVWWTTGRSHGVDVTRALS